MSYFSRIAVLAGLLLLLGGCKKTEVTPIDIEANDFVIANIDSKIDIMASDLYKRLKNSRILTEGGYLDSSTYFDTLREIVIDSVVSLEARDISVEDDWLQNRRYKEEYLTGFVNYLFERIVLDPIKIDSVDVDTFYQAYPEAFVRPEEFRASHLIVSGVGLMHSGDSISYSDFTGVQLDSIAHERVAGYRAEMDSGASFADLAYKYSMHRPSGDLNGDLGYFTRGTYVQDFENVVCSLKVGQISEPFKTRDGWHLAMLTDHIDSSLMGLDEVYDRIEQQLKINQARERSIQFTDSIANVAEYVFNDSILKITATLVPDSIWAAVVNGRDTIDHFKLAEFLYDYKKAMGLDTLTLENKKEALKTKSGQILIAQAGDDLGFSDDSAFVAQMDELYHYYASKIIGKGSSDPGFEPSDSLIKDYYDKHIDDYIIKKPVNVQHIIVEDSVFGEFLRDQALSGIDFLDLAEKHYPGAEEIRVAAADLGYIGPDEMPEEFFKMAMRTAKGDVSHPVKTEWGYHIIYVVDKQLNKSLEQVSSQIANILRQQHHKEFRTAWQNELLSRHDVRYNLAPVKKIELPPFNERK